MTVSARSALPHVHSEILDPDETRRVAPSLAAADGPDVWLYRYAEPDAGWRLSVASLAAPGTRRLSLGGFRIAPESRTSLPGYDNDREAIELAVGMDEKVYWSRVLRVGGPLGLRHIGRVVGGKCVLLPTPDARVGRARDHELLDFAVACLRDANAAGEMQIVTGQDLGHGTMSDRVTSSLAYMHERFEGSMLADTSRPTGEGNFHLLRGMLAGARVPLERARVALVGAGNIGRYLVRRLRDSGVANVTAIEPSPDTRVWLAEAGVDAWPLERKLELLAAPVDAVVVNASGGSLDDAAVRVIAANPTVRVVCGAENLAMPNAANERVLLAAGKVYCHPELGGMMGYLTAVEEYLARREGRPFDVDTMLTAARRLHDVGYEGMVRVVAGRYRETFQAAVRAIYS